MSMRMLPPGCWVVVTPPLFYVESQKFAREQPRFYFTTRPILLQALLDAKLAPVAKAVASTIQFQSLAEALGSGLRGRALDVSTDGTTNFDGISEQ